MIKIIKTLGFLLLKLKLVTKTLGLVKCGVNIKVGIRNILFSVFHMDLMHKI